MKIVHLSMTDGGGAGRAAYRLHCGLRRLGYDSYMLVFERHSNDPAIERFAAPRDLLSRMRRGFRRGRIKRDFARYRATLAPTFEIFSDDRAQYGAELVNQMPAADVTNLHWVPGLVDYTAFFSALPPHMPVVWTLHDMNPFTGGCHYDGGCERYAASCGSCPVLGSRDEQDLSRRIWRRKRDALARLGPDRLHVVADSYWLEAEARRSTLLGRFPATTIHYGLDLEAFAPRDRSFARSVLGVPPDAKVVLFAAESLSNPRKGFALLSEALAGLAGVPGLFLLSLGWGDQTVPGPAPHLHLGYVGNDRFLSLVYSAADVFVIPSLQEAFGQTALEALACGVPVVGFAVGGIPDMVRPGETGLLAPAGDVPGLRGAIAELLRDPVAREKMSANCRRLAVEEYSLERQARHYVDLYQAILERGAAQAAVGGPSPPAVGGRPSAAGSVA